MSLLPFLLLARTKTYAGNGGKVKPAFKGSDQLEYKEGKYFYRDIYYTGKGIFTGLEAVYFGNKPVWAMSYAGDFKKMTEQEIDSVLRRALRENWRTARLWHKVAWKSGDYRYICTPNPASSINEIAGAEKILRKGREVYSFYYAGGVVGK